MYSAKYQYFRYCIEFNHHANRAKATCGEFMKLVGLMPLKGSRVLQVRGVIWLGL